MQLIQLRSSPRFGALKWAAAGASVSVAVLLATTAGLAGVLAGFVACVVAALALRTKAPAGRLRLRREGWCEWIPGAVAPADAVPGSGTATEMGLEAAFEAAGWLVLRLRERGLMAHRRSGALLLVVAPDAAGAEELRQLKVWINLAAPRAALNSGDTQWS